MLDNFKNKNLITSEEAGSIYQEHFLISGNTVSIGKFMSCNGYVAKKQMTKGVLRTYYIKKEIAEQQKQFSK